MGCSTFANFTVLPEIAVAKIREDAPFDKVCYIGCGVTTGIGAVLNTAKVEPGAKARRVRARRHRAQRDPGAAARRRRHDHRRRHSTTTRRPWGERFGMTHFVNPKEIGGDLVPYLVNLTKTRRRPDRRLRLHLRMRRQCRADARGAGKLPSRLGREHHHRRGAGRRQEIKTRPFQLVTGRVWKGTAFGGARGRTDVPKIVDWYMDGKIEIDPMITHVMPLADINKAFDLMHAGESIRSVVVY